MQVTMKITTLDEARQFDSFLAAYSIEKALTSLPYLPLDVIFQKFPPVNDGGRLFYALLDLKINVVLLSHDRWDIGCAWNQSYKTAEERAKDPLENEAIFKAKMAFHAPLNSFVLRYRAVWDKIFNCMVLMVVPDKYDKFRNTKKGRRKAFLQAVGDHPSISRPALERIMSELEHFESVFRTPEIHDTGSIRTWSFTIATFSGSPHELLTGYWNNLVHTLDSLTKRIESA